MIETTVLYPVLVAVAAQPYGTDAWNISEQIKMDETKVQSALDFMVGTGVLSTEMDAADEKVYFTQGSVRNWSA